MDGAPVDGNRPLARALRRQKSLNRSVLRALEGGLRSVRITSAPGPDCVKTFFLLQKLHATGGRSASTRRSEDIFALASPESTRAQARATLSDLNGHTMRITARALHARIATRSGLMPTMFITRVRL